MKHLLVVLGLLVSSVAYASYPMAWGQYTSQVPREKRVAIVIDARQYASTFANQTYAGNQGNMGAFIERINEQGGEVHVFTTDYFEDTLSSRRDFGANYPICSSCRPRWSRLGENYPVAILMDFLNIFGSGGTGFVQRYLRADSTSTQIIHFGDGNSSGTNLRDATGINGAGSACSLSVSAVLIDRAAVPVVSNGRDTIAAFNMPYQLRTGGITSLPGVREVIRYFDLIDNNPFVASDSIASNPGDTLLWAFKVRYNTQGNATVANPVTEIVLKTANLSNTVAYSQAPILWAIMNKYVSLDPIKISVNWDDIGNFGTDPAKPNTPANRIGNYTVPKPTLLDSLRNVLKDIYGVTVNTISAEADSLVYYSSGSYRVGDFSILKRWGTPVSIHVHNGDSTNVYSVVMGTATDSKDTTSATIKNRRVAHRYAPGAATVYQRYGIYDKIRLSDSLLTYNGFTVGPWIDFPNDNYLPPNVNSAEAPLDSLMGALYDAGKYYIRGYVLGQNAGAWIGNLPTTGTRVFNLPDAVYNTATGKRIYCVSTIAASGNPLDIIDQRNDFGVNLPQLLGFSVPLNRGASDGFFTTPFIYGVGTGLPSGNAAQYKTNGLCKNSNIYQHPKNFTSMPDPTTGGTGWWPVQSLPVPGYADYSLFIKGYLAGLEALKYCAGNKYIHQWVYPWQTLNRGRGM